MSAAATLADGPRDRILLAATDHVRRMGVARLSVVHVARAVGMTHANIYRYFPSKAALVEEVGTDWLRGVEQRLGDITQAPDPAYDKLERFLTLLARTYEEKARADPAVFGILAETTAISRERHERRVRDLLGRIIEEGVATRAFASGDVRRSEQLVLDVMHRFIDPSSVLRAVSSEPARPSSWESRRERATRLLVRGLNHQRD